MMRFFNLAHRLDERPTKTWRTTVDGTTWITLERIRAALDRPSAG
jgi:hypothetical protein